MQFVEVSDLGVRAAVYRLAPRGAGPVFVLLPMIHVGSAAYYAEVARRLAACDAIFAEGVSSRRAAHLLRVHMIVAGIKRLELVSQNTMDVSAFRHKMIHTDVTGAEFDVRWGRIPLLVRAVIALGVPALAVYLWLHGTRAFLARHLELNDLPSRDEVLNATDWEGLARLDETIVDWRDARLLEHVERASADRAPDAPGVIGVVWGARHMRAVTRLLLGRLGYRVAAAEWITVFDL